MFLRNSKSNQLNFGENETRIPHTYRGRPQNTDRVGDLSLRLWKVEIKIFGFCTGLSLGAEICYSAPPPSTFLQRFYIFIKETGH